MAHFSKGWSLLGVRFVSFGGGFKVQRSMPSGLVFPAEAEAWKLGLYRGSLSSIFFGDIMVPQYRVRLYPHFGYSIL